ncbi:MAG: 2OG-Fe(II) oxygenase family protein [Candidatus Binatia bacterium]|nr:2OG-Fe(II) oxygenase family protein [Candidatus Binatia bacterium]
MPPTQAPPSSDEIPEIDVTPLFGDRGSARDEIDRKICEAASRVGFMTIAGAPLGDDAGRQARDSLLRLFRLPEGERRKLWKKNFAPENPNLYRGWFPLESAEPRSREGFEIGPDVVRELPDSDDDLLFEPSVFPPEEQIPGWRRDAVAYYRAMESIGYALLASISRGIGISEDIFRGAFDDGISTLRLLRYPGRPAGEPLAPELEKYFMRWAGERVEVVCGGHVDSGLVTILAQCDAAGLQARTDDGHWIDVPPTENGLIINFGGLLARWTGGRVRATMHRVLSSGTERFSIPFFFEPRPNTVIAPLPLDGIEPFAPFQFGDYLWATTTKFPENHGLGHLRPARAPYRDPFEKQS